MTVTNNDTQRAFRVALVAWSSNVVWVTADNEDDAIAKAEQLWEEDDSQFSFKDGGIDGCTVLESRKVQP